jgi:hypothetical protein
LEEIDERKRFLQEMTDAKSLTPEISTQVKAEIAERLRELKQVDALIKSELTDAKQQAAAGGSSSGAAASGTVLKSTVDKSLPKTKPKSRLTRPPAASHPLPKSK